MAMFYPQIKYYHAITIDYTKVPLGAVTDMVVCLNESNFNDDFKTLSGARSPTSALGDIRFFSDSALETPLCFDITYASLNAAPASSIISINVKVPTVSNTVNTVIYVGWVGTTALAALSSADTYGSYNVYKTGFALFAEGNNDGGGNYVLDRTRNGRSGLKRASTGPATSTTSPRDFGPYQLYNGTTDYVDYPAFNTGATFTAMCSFDYTGTNPTTTAPRLVGNKLSYDNTSGFEMNIAKSSISGEFSGSSSTYISKTTWTNVSGEGWLTLAGKYSTSQVVVFASGLNKGSGTVATVTNSANKICAGYNAGHNDSPFKGRIDNVVIYTGVLADAEIVAMQNNWTQPTTFATAGVTRSGPYYVGSPFTHKRGRMVK
jgi:hypothetical protein